MDNSFQSLFITHFVHNLDFLKNWFRSILFAVMMMGIPYPGISQERTIVFGDSTKTVVANQRFALTGTITQSENNKPLPGAGLFVDGLKYGDNSDANGRYAIFLPAGKYRVTARHIGKAPIQKLIAIYAQGILNFELKERAEALEEVIVKARKPDDNIKEVMTGLVRLNISEIKRLPAFMGEVDVIKSLQTLPGVTTVGEGSAGFNVRGGRVDQNLVLMDGGQVFNSSHALGLLSNFNPDVVEDFALYKGNIPAQLGGRVSSVLDVRNRTGDMSKYKIKGGLGFLSSRLTAEGPLIKDKTSFIVGSRISYSDWILRSVQNTDVRNSDASFYDINGNITHRLGNRNSLSLSYYRGHDYFRFSNQFGYDYTTTLSSFRWKAVLSERMSSAFSAVAGDYSSILYDYDVTHARKLTNGIRYYQLKQNFLYTHLEKHALNFGAEAVFNNGKPETSAPFGTNSTTLNQRVEKDKGREFAVYANEEYNLSSVVSLSTGLRYSYYQYMGPDTVYQYASGKPRRVDTMTDTAYYSAGTVIKFYQGFEPRLSVRLSLSEKGSLKASYNRMRQYIHLISNGAAPTPVDIWQVSNAYILPQIGNNFSLGYFRNTADNMFEGSVEVFYKLTSHVTDYKDFAQLLLNRHLETELLQGTGKSYGLEWYIKKTSGPWTGWFSYTYSRSLLKIDGAYPEEKINQGNWYPSNYDKPHNLAITANHKLGKKMRFSGNFNLSTGRPVSAVVTNYPANTLVVPVFSNRNQYRIPTYIRLDVSITLNSVFTKIDDNLTLSIYNLLGRRNAYSVYYQQPFGSDALQAYKLSILGSALPSLTYNFNF